MKNINLLLKTIFTFTVLVFIGCEKEEYTLGAIKAPSVVKPFPIPAPDPLWLNSSL